MFCFLFDDIISSASWDCSYSLVEVVKFTILYLCLSDYQTCFALNLCCDSLRSVCVSVCVI